MGHDFSPHNPSGPHADANGSVAIESINVQMLLILRRPQAGFPMMGNHLRAVHGMNMDAHAGMRFHVTNRNLMHRRRVATSDAGA